MSLTQAWLGRLRLKRLASTLSDTGSAWPLLAVIFGAFAAHFFEIGVYGAALYVLVHSLGVGTLTGQLAFSFENCLYFSAETYTSLGFGDLTPVGGWVFCAGTSRASAGTHIAGCMTYTCRARPVRATR